MWCELIESPMWSSKGETAPSTVQGKLGRDADPAVTCEDVRAAPTRLMTGKVRQLWTGNNHQGEGTGKSRQLSRLWGARCGSIVEEDRWELNPTMATVPILFCQCITGVLCVVLIIPDSVHEGTRRLA
jgi:hypothetical protein